MAPSPSALVPSAAPANGEDILSLGSHGLLNLGRVHGHLAPAALTELAVERGEGLLTARGALVAYTGAHTGRSPQDRYVVTDESTRDAIAWGPVNRPMEPAVFDRLLDKIAAYFQRRDLFVFDGAACADPRYRLNVRVVAEKAWHALFAHCLFLRLSPEQLAGCRPDLTILHAADIQADPAADSTRSGAFIVLNLARRLVLIGGTHYAGEVKKSVFSFLNYLLPQQGVFPMHCSANIGPADDTALFFGLSGTGKTTLSADRLRRLIGDDEHAWSDEGVFNLEGGCYAKTIHLSAEGEPQIWNAIRFGCVLENVVVDPNTRVPDYDDDRFTENTRAAYPVDFIDNCEPSGCGGHPHHIVFLTCDAFGVLPPVSRLTPPQALYHFLSGYTAKVAGTEAGVTEPKATFSTCFAAPFLPLPPVRYAEMLAERLRTYDPVVWLINTGWTGGPYGVSNRIKLAHTRTMVRVALSGLLNSAPCTPDPNFGVLVPDTCPGVPPEILRPRETWKDPADYDRYAHKLAELFRANFQQYGAQVPEPVRQAGPRG
jgi:phosphoenolpyruvate carboxykinase (ATP)